MPFSESDTRAKLIDSAIRIHAWNPDADLIRRRLDVAGATSIDRITRSF